MDPLIFPELPASNTGWSHQIIEAYTVLLQAYTRAVRLLRLEDGEPIRLRLLARTIKGDVVPLLKALETQMPNYTQWIEECAEKLISVITNLEIMALELDNLVHIKLDPVDAFENVRTGRPGHPSKSIKQEWLKEVFAPHRNLSISALSDAMGIHRNTLRKQLRLYGISQAFSSISEAELDILVKDFKLRKPNAGIRYIVGYFRKKGIKVQHTKVRKSLHRVDSVGQALRNRKQKPRGVYKVPHPNALWHMDGHHKLIRWGIVINGIVDGYCRTLVGLRASTNNRASTVLDLFLNAVKKYGVPARARGDRGGENVEVSVWMILHQGPNRNSFLWGDSTRNSRIERMWVEAGSQVIRQWRAFFSRLERLHSLNIENDWHLWLLMFLFLDEINKELAEFTEDWNHHPVSRFGHDKSPMDMRLLGEIKHGRYVGRSSSVDNIHPGIAKKYAINHDDPDQLARQIADDQQPNIRHDAIEPPKYRSPFGDQAHDTERIFGKAIEDLDSQEYVPSGLGLLEEEWGEGGYPTSEILMVARREVDIILPFDIWWLRAVKWAHGLELVISIQLSLD